MSMIYGDNFIGQTTFSSGYTFYKSKVVDASNLILPATTLIQSCYAGMFRDCTALTTAPVLSATTLAQSCYDSMFYNCTNLNYIKYLSRSISTTYCTNWVYKVAASGTFVKNPSITSWTTGISGIPSGWTVQDYEG